MEANATLIRPLADRSPGRHFMAAGVAVLVSLGLHFALVRWVPPLPVGRPPKLESFRRMPSVRLQDVRMNARDRVERPSLFRPERPEEFVELGLEKDAFASVLDDLLPETPAVSTGPLAGESGALVAPEPVEERIPWEPRQEILQIEKAIYAEDISALPRRYSPDLSRAVRVPDVTLPAEKLPDDAMARVEAALSTDAQALDASAGGGWAMPGALPFEASAGRGAMEPLREPSALLDEALAEVTELAPVEQLLELELSAASVPEDPDYVYFKIQIKRRGSDVLPVLPKDLLLIQDTSISMTQRKLNQCKEGLRRWLDALNPGDRFDLLDFSQRTTRCFDEWQPVSPGSRARANWFIENMTCSGRTDVYASLRALLAIAPTPGRPFLAVLITDARPTTGLVDSSEIIERFTQDNGGRASVFAFGGGRRVNRFLLDLLSYKNRGDSLIVVGNDEIPAGLEDLGRQLNRPVLADLTYRFAGLDESEIYPRTLTHFYLDRPLEIYGRASGALPKVAFQVVGASGGERHDMVFSLDWREAASPEEDLRTAWAWHKAYHLIGERILSGSDTALEDLRRLSRDFGIVLPYGGEFTGR